MAHMVGLSISKRVVGGAFRRSRWVTTRSLLRSASSPPLDCAVKSRPAQKARPLPVRTTTRTSGICVGPHETGPQGIQHGGRDGIHPLRPVQGDDSDLGGGLVEDLRVVRNIRFLFQVIAHDISLLPVVSVLLDCRANEAIHKAFYRFWQSFIFSLRPGLELELY
jgi:hypothetical protein